MRTAIIVFTAVVTALAVHLPLLAQTWEVTSPDEGLKLTVRLTEPGTTPRLSYRLDATSPEAELLAWSPLGISWQDQEFGPSLQLRSVEPVRTIDEHYTLPHGKQRELRNHARELTLTFTNFFGTVVALDLRAYDDGVAFRYRFPEHDSFWRGVIAEHTGFSVPDGSTLWAQPFDPPGRYTPAYEAYYVNGIDAGTTSPSPQGWAYPALFRLHDGANWILITEAGLDASYAGTRLAAEAPENTYTVRFPDPAEGNGVGGIYPVSRPPFASSWRVVIAGDNPGDIIHSTLVTHVAPPSRIDDTSWIVPGRASWDWWSSQNPSLPRETRYAYVDLAAEMGWEYYLIDANWNHDGMEEIRKVVDYAWDRGVGILLWYNSGGPHNMVTEEPRNRMHERLRRRAEFRLLSEMGVRGVKVDFFQSDKQEIIEHYLDILDDAADFELMVNFHGSTLPRGWNRTWPHLMTMEAMRAAEAYSFDPTYPESSPRQNTILPFTRNVVGAMDYTPVALSDNNYPRRTTNAHELALSVVFESGLIHFADNATTYRTLESPAKEFLAAVPAAWDEVRYLAGTPGSHVVLARRHGDTWYVGGINGLDEPLHLSLPLDFLSGGVHAAQFIGDGNSDRSFSHSNTRLRGGQTYEITLRPRGGFVLTLKPGS